MTEKKELIGRGYITTDAKGNKRSLGGYWRHDPQPSPTSWTGRAFADYRELLKTGQRVSELNDQFIMAKAKNQAPPAYDVHVRTQQVKQDLRKLEGVRERLSRLDDELLKTQHELRAKVFEYPPDSRSAGLRAELRQHLRTMNPEQQRAALRRHEYRSAMAEQLPEISGVGESFYDAVIQQELEFKFPTALAGLREAQAALETSVGAYESVKLTVENEAQAVSGQLPEPAPQQPTKPWVD